MGRALRSVLIDNYDSYTYNLYHLLAEVNGEEPVLVRNDDFESYEDFVALVGGMDQFDNVVISPGPGRPERRKDFGGCSDVLQGTHVPVLGVCLGHQGICTTYGAKVMHAAGGVAHGVISAVQHDGEALFRGVPDSFHVVRYHSLAVDADTLPACLKPVAWCKGVDSDAQVLMGVRHESRPLFGVQFHPESICTAHGRALLENFRDLTVCGWDRGSPLPHPVLSKRRTPRLLADDGGLGSGRVPRANVQLDEDPAGSMEIRWRKIVCPAVASEESFTETLFAQLYANSEAPQFWLDSPLAARGCRFSYMGDGSGPYAEVVSCDVDGRTSVLDSRGNVVEGPCDASIFSVLERRLRAKSYEGTDVFPFRLNCGYVGYLGYELKTQCGASPGHHRSEVPNATMLFADRVVVIDHTTAEVYMLCAGYPGAEEDAEAERWFAHVQAGVEVADRVAQVEMDSDEAVEASMPDEHSSRGRQHPPPTFELERDCNSYLEDIRECLREIYEGESYEVA